MTTIASTIAPDAEWAPIHGFPSYQATRDGRVRRARGCRGYRAGFILSAWGPNRGGYYGYKLCENGVVSTVLRGQCVALAYIGPRPLKEECRHLDGNPVNDRLGNLAWGTSKENGEDMVAHGRSPRGERNGFAKLTTDDVLLIRCIHAEQQPNHGALALLFDVSKGQISKIVRGDRWGWL